MNIVALLIIFGFLFVIIVFQLAMFKRIETAGPNEVLIISGRRRYIRRKDGTRFIVGFRILKGGRTFVWPHLEKMDRLSLEQMSVDINIPKINTADGVPVAVDAIAQVKINGDDLSIAKAVENFLSKDTEQIRQIAFRTVESHVMEIIGLLPSEEIFSRREDFSSKVRQAVSTDFDKMGLNMLSFVVRNIGKHEG